MGALLKFCVTPTTIMETHDTWQVDKYASNQTFSSKTCSWELGSSQTINATPRIVIGIATKMQCSLNYTQPNILHCFLQRFLISKSKKKCLHGRHHSQCPQKQKTSSKVHFKTETLILRFISSKVHFKTKTLVFMIHNLLVHLYPY